MGRFIVATGVNPSTDHVKVDVVDPILTEGSLLLIDPGHPIEPWPGGVPTSGAPLTNLAIDYAQDVLPGLSETQLKPQLVIGSTFLADGLVERTTKGGLHLGRNNDVGDANTWAAVTTHDDFIRDDDGLPSILSHDFFISLWARSTKAYLDTYTPGFPPHSVFGTSAAMFQFYSRRAAGSGVSPTDSRRIGYRESGAQNVATTLGPLLQNVGITNIATLAPSTDFGRILTVGNGSGITSGNRGKTGSFVFYRFTLEDLTVSGRTYEEVDAIDHALFTQRVLTPGGDLYGDTFTDPATI